MQTKSALGKNLLYTINVECAGLAVSFCSERAIHLIVNSSVSLNANIKRFSYKHHNPDIVANADKLEYILTAKEALKDNQNIQP